MATIAIPVSQLKVGMLVYGYGSRDGKDRWSESDEVKKMGWRITAYDQAAGKATIKNTKSGCAQSHSFALDYRAEKLIRVEKPEPMFNEWGEDAL